ncbi:MAG: hypothetical protein IKW83_04295 [Muribaculaceae bacterium]|nr:hypothetical protein [Muribaculaceae bacterium]
MKKSLLLSLFALVAAMAVAATYPASYYTIAPETATLVGDVNCDQAVTASDVTELYNYLLTGSTTYLSSSDVNGDGNVTASDVTAVYDVLLGVGGSATPATLIKMNDYISATSSGAQPQHVWKNTEDVIYITLDGVEENMYVLVRSGGKWTLKDITGSNKAGFKSSGTIKAMWVRNANWSTDEVGDLNIPQDCAFGSGTYTCSGKTVGINLPLELYESKIILGGTNVNTSTGMTYCRHITSLQDINRFINGDSWENEDATVTPKAQLINGQYVIYARHTDVNSSGNTVFHVTLPDSRSFRYTANFEFKPGQVYTLMNPGPGTGWTRDFVIGYYNSAYDPNSSFLTLNDNGYTNEVTIPVGYELNLVPREGGATVYDGTVQNLIVTNTTCVTTYNSSFATPTLIAQEVGYSYVYFKYTTTYGDSYTYAIKVTVNPSLWLYGYTKNNSNKMVPTIYYNMKGTSAPKITDDTGNQEVSGFSMSKGHAAAIVWSSSTCKLFKNSNSPYYYGSYTEKYDIGALTQLWAYMDHEENIYYQKKSGDYYYVMKNNLVMQSKDRPFSDFKVDYTTGNIACLNTTSTSSELYILGIGLVRSDYGHDNLHWGPNGTSTGERVTYTYNYAFSNDRLILRVHRQRTQFGQNDNEMIYTNNYYVYTYNSQGQQLSSPTFDPNDLDNSSSLFYDGNTLFYVSNSTQGKFTTIVGDNVSTITTNKKNIYKIGYRNGYVYGLRCVKESGKYIYYFFFGSLNQVLNNTCTEINLGEYPNFTLEGMFFETSKN